MRASILLVMLALARPSFADEPDPPAPGVPQPAEPTPGVQQPVAPAVEPPPSVPLPPKLDPESAARIDELENKVDELEHQQRINDSSRELVTKLTPLLGYINAFIDVGAFAVGGNGSGIRSDIGHLYYPQYAGRIAGEWVFMGDPLATMINSNGDPADASNSREDRADTIRSAGRPSLIANSLGLTFAREVGDGFSLASLVELLPRPGQNILDIELAHIDYRPTDRYNLILSAGKIDSVLGVEYRAQDAPSRLGVTPSLLCRYLCGRPLGVSARLTRGKLTVSAAVTDGDNFEASFEPQDSLKANKVPTASAHVQWVFPVGQGLELGVSGAYGPQDAQTNLEIRQWHYGFDAKLRDLHEVDVTAEFVQGRQDGQTMGTVLCGVAQCLTYKAAYVSADLRRWNAVIPYVRVDWRSAVHTSGVDFVYESHTLRATVGAHFDIGRHVIAKVEYTYNRELEIPQFPDDVFTTSLVVTTE